MKLRLKRILTVALCVALGCYVLLAMTSFNNPKDTHPLCTKVVINIEDESTNGFLTTAEVRRILERAHLYPYKRRMAGVNPRDIEDKLKDSPFVKTAQCFKTKDGCVSISITQRLPIIRVKNVAGEDYYLDDHGGIMPNSNYTSDLIIATGYISKWYARNYLSHLAVQIMGDDFWRNQIVQVNVQPDLGVELVPRVGDHVVYLGCLPQTKYVGLRKGLVSGFVAKKLDRLGKFYKYGLSQAGWNKYSCIDLEFDNQIICKKR